MKTAVSSRHRSREVALQVLVALDFHRGKGHEVSIEDLMDDVVVVGYGVQRKRAVTGSIEKIESEQITALPVPSIEAALQGQAAGVQVSQGSTLCNIPR